MKGFNKQIERVDGKTFKFETEEIKILRYKFTPVIVCTVDVDDQAGSTWVEIISLQLKTKD